MHLENQAQIRALLFDKAFIKVPAKYFNYNNVFLIENVEELLNNSKISKHTIKLKKNK